MRSTALTAPSWNKQSLIVERRPLHTQNCSDLVLQNLPFPPALNNIFASTPHGRVKSDRYRTWRNAATWEIRLQKPRRVPGPVSIVFVLQDGGSRADLDDLAKAPIDLLCDLHLIDGDGPSVIREVTLRWGAIAGLRIEVRSA